MSAEILAAEGDAPLGRLAGARVVRLEGFEEPSMMDGDERASYRRRFLTLFLDEGSARRGGLGCVCRATNAMGEVYALKTLLEPVRSEGEDDAAHAARVERSHAAFRREYEAHRALAGFKGFPRLYGYAMVEGVPAIVMEWVEGVTLSQARLELAVDDAGRMAPLDAARLGRDLFGLLTRLELVGDGFVHRDVSPSNIMLRTTRLSIAEQASEGDFDLCLIDFGSSVPLDPVQDPRLTSVQATVRRATVAYAAPEMLSDDVPRVVQQRRSAAVDVYAAASVLFELVCAALPFDAVRDPGASPYRVKVDGTPAALASAHAPGSDLAAVLLREPEVAFAAARAMRGMEVDADPEALRSALERIDGQLGDLISPCLATEQARRPTARAMRESLDAFCANYARNVERTLQGDSLIPCTAGSCWNDSTSPYRWNRVIDSVGRAFAYALLVGVTVLTSVLLDGLEGSLALGPLRWEGPLSAPALAALLLLPGAGGLLVRAAARRRGGEGTLAGSLALGAVALAVLAALSHLSVRGMEDTGALTSALFVTAAAGWLPMVLDYAMMVVPALMVELRRALPGRSDDGARTTAVIDSTGRTLSLEEVCDAVDELE